MSCLTVYGLKNRPEKSNLLKDLQYKHGIARGEYLYDIIYSDSPLQSSFINWWQREENPLITKQGEPATEMVDKWLSYVNRRNQLGKTFQSNNIKMTIEEFNSISEGLSYYMMNTLFNEKGMNPEDLLTPNHKTVKNILNSSLNTVIGSLESNLDAFDEAEAERIPLLIEAINADRKGFYEAFNNYLQAKLRLTLNIDSILSDDIETKQDKETKDSAFNKNSIEFDTKDGAPASIKVLISSLPKIMKDGRIEPNTLGLPTLVDYNSTFNFIQQKLVSLPGNIELMLSELSKNVDVRPELKFLVKKLNFNKPIYKFPSSPFQLLSETKLRTEFVNQFNKSKLQIALHIKDKEGNIKVIDANIDKLRDSILKQWENDFKIKTSNNPKFLTELAWVERARPEEVLKFLGIDVPLDKVDNKTIQIIKDYGLSEDSDVANIFSPKGDAGVKNRLLELADIYAETSDDVIDFQVYNAENKLIYSITLNNYLTSVAKELSYYAGTDELLEMFPELFNNTYSQNSIYLERLMEGQQIKIGIYDGFVSDINKNSGKTTKNLKEKDLLLQRLTGVLTEGQYPMLRTADRGIENFIYFEGDRGLLVDSVRDAKDYYRLHLEDELQTVKKDNPDVVFFNKNNTKLRVFGYTDKYGKPHLLTDSVPMSELVDPEFDITKNEKVDTFLDKMIENMVANEKQLLAESGIYQQQGGEYIYLKDLIEKFGSIEAVEELFTLNSHIANIETTKVFSGDLAYYKNPSDIFKRMSMMNSTKESLRVDDEIDAVIGSLTNEFEKKNGYETPHDSSQIRTITIKDVKGNMEKGFTDQELKSLKKAFGSNTEYYDAYKRMDEADGFAYVTMDEYRRMSIRAGEWTRNDENLYQDLAEGNVKYDENTVHRFTMKKYQYTGKLFTGEGLNIPAGRKFAFMPLVPGLIDGTVLEQLNDQMLANGVGMAFYESAAKFGHIGNKDGAYHQIYDENGEFDISLDESSKYDDLHYKYLGNQLKIHSKAKGKIKGTQRNKIIKGNFYENGEIIPNESQLETLIYNYDALQSKRIKNAYKSLKKRFGVEEDIDYLDVYDLGQFINVVVDQGLSQGFSTNDLIALDLLREIPAFDILPNKQKIESLITSTLSNKVIDNKRKGDAFAQASDVGFEIDINERTEKLATRHNLKFYRYALNEDGTLSDRLLPMEIMVPLPTALITYVKDMYGDGKTLTQDDLDVFNAQLAEDNEVFERTGEKSDLITIATYSGFRIPTQDASSLEVAQVKKFFMPHMTGMVVVPKAIVVKTGSDFDIDKLNFYMAHFTLDFKDKNKIAAKFIKDKNIPVKAMRGIMYNEFDIVVDTNVEERFIESILLAAEADITDEAIKSLNAAFKATLKSFNTNVTGLTVPNGKGKVMDDMSKAELDNFLLETEIAITMSNENNERLLAPLDGTIIKKVIDTIRKDMGWTSQEIKDGAKDHLHEVFTNKKNIEKFIAFLSGKAGVGQVAVHITNHILAQQAGLEMKSLHNYFGFGEESHIPVGRIKNDSGEYISEVLSALLTSYVDIAKDPYILDLNVINATANTVLMMTRWGIKHKDVFYFINQPIIKDYLKARSIEEAVTTDKDSGKMSKSETIDEIFAKYGIVKDPDSLIYKIEQDIENGKAEETTRPGRIYNDLKISDLQVAISKSAKGAKVDPKIQLQALDLFLEYQRQSKYFQEMIRSTSPDTQQFKNVSLLKSQVAAKQSVIDGGMFKNYDKMFDTFIGEAHDAKEQYFTMIKDLFLAQDERYVASIDALKEAAMATTISTDEKQAIANKIENGLINFILGQDVHDKLNHKEVFNSMFKGSKSLPKQIKKIQNAYKKAGYTPNFLIDQLLPMIDDKGQGYDSMKFKNRKLTNMEAEQLIFDFNDINESGFDEWVSEVLGYKVENFIENLWVYNMVQSGIDNSPFSLIRAIPSKVHFNKLHRSLNKAIKPNMVTQEEVFFDVEKYTGYNSVGQFVGIGQFMLNNPGIFYGSPNENYSVNWDRDTENFRIKNKKTNRSQTPTGKYNYRQYGNLLEESAPNLDTGEMISFEEAMANAVRDETLTKEDFYNLSSSQVNKIDPSLEKNLHDFLKSLGVDVKLVDQIKDGEGNPINAYGVARLADRIIELTENPEGLASLPEEAAHMITALLGPNHPLMKQMMNEIINYDVYNNVKREYAGVYDNEQQFRFEAVGKLIAQHIIEQKPLESEAKEEQTLNWFQRVLRVLARLFRNVDTNIPKQSMDTFEMMAKNILSVDGQIMLKEELADSAIDRVKGLVELGKRNNMDKNGAMPSSINPKDLVKSLNATGIIGVSVRIDNQGKLYFYEDNQKIIPLNEYYNLVEGPTQNEAKAKFLATADRLVGNVDTPTAQARYQLRDKILSGRVSDAQKALFEKNKSQKQIDEIQNTLASEIARETGTQLHDYNEEIMNYLIGQGSYGNVEVGNTGKTTNVKPAKPSNITSVQQKSIERSIESLIKGISQKQTEIDKNGKVMIFTENFVVDDINDVGGSQDLTVLYSDASASIYDYKFINFKKQKVNGRWIYPDHLEINFMKEKSYSLQLAEYKRILKEVYGINKIRATRILPFNVQYTFNDKGVITPTIRELEGFNMNKNYLMPLPVANELTEDENINKILASLFEQQKQSVLKIQRNFGNDEIKERVKIELASVKRSIRSIQLSNDFAPLFESINVTLNNEGKLLNDIDVASIGELNRMEAEIDMFNSIYEHVLVHAKKKSLSDDLDKIARRLADAKVALREKRNELLLSLNPDINIAQKEIDGMKSWFAYLSEINHPAFEMANDYFKTANGNIQRAMTDLNKELTSKTDTLKSWASGRGMTLMEAFRKIKTSKNKLINTYSDEFYKDRTEKRIEGDTKWFKDRYQITEEGKKRYKEDLENQKKLLSSRFEEDSALYKKMLQDWESHNDLLNEPSAWVDKWSLWKYAELKDKAQFYSDEYKDLLQPQNKELLEYFNFYKETNTKLNSLVNEKIESNFIANIKKDFVEVLSQTGNPISTFKQLKADFADQFRVQYDGEDTVTEDGKIPLLYYNNFLIKDKESGKWVVDEEANSEDLSKVLTLFAESVFRKKELTDIQHVIEALKIHIADQPVMKTDAFGKVKIDEYTQNPELDNKSTKNSDLFDTHMRVMLYGEKIQNEDSVILGKYSANKAITSAMKLFSANTLALSYVSAFGNVGSGFANVYIKAAGGNYYKTKHIRKTMSMRMKNDPKFSHMTEFFKIENENWARKMANKLSASKITKNITFDNLFLLWQKGDDFIANTVLVSMAQNYGIHPETGTIKRVEELPEGTKSIFEMFNVEGDNISSGLTDAQFDDFRRKVVYIARRVKGSNTTEELSKIQTTVWGKSLMFFKNWIGPMASERFGGIKYTKDLEEFEYGRYRSLFKSVFKEAWMKKLPKLLLDVTTLGLIKYKGDTALLTKQFEEFKKANPHLAHKMDVNDYIALRERSIREGLFEMRIITALAMLILAANMDWDDDGEKDYKKTKAQREAYKFIKRTYLELSFFSNPASVTELIRNPLPIISVGVNLFNIVRNTGDEFFDIILDPDEVDKTPRGHYLKKASIGKPIFAFFEDITKDEE